ncbi:hypothetical protein [Umezawaea sp. Da 62-37]|uniref:hypothetical protein n=1 Tax=Umezawaea sp. Da 62-37 TaxID=3075927 RepID=UPI0028F6FC34|nr:hypothetical protein [Umezawaea sp. Da 62-37]WNV84916.1 hypothetical protein RM788_43295 [Umezawaea sp. Da 62-37]
MAADDDQAVQARLSKVFTTVKAWRTRTEMPQPEPEPGSSLAGDDQATSPLHVSHAVVGVLVSAVDHFETVRLVVQEQHVLPARGGFTLLRAALENAAAAVWLLGPSDRQDRVFRQLRWEWANVNDGNNIFKLMGEMSEDETHAADVKAQVETLRKAQKTRLQDLARAHGMTPARVGDVIANPDGFGRIVETAGDHARGLTGKHAKWAWMTCSGLAHSRRWTEFAFLEKEVMPGATDDVGVAKIGATEEHLAAMAEVAAQMLTEAWRLFDERRGSLIG